MIPIKDGILAFVKKKKELIEKVAQQCVDFINWL